MSSLPPGFIWSFLILGLYGEALIIRAGVFGVSRRLFGSVTSGVKIYSLIFLPGVLVHEMAHFLVATFLRVPTGKIEIFPDEIDDGRVKMGSVQIAKTDFIRVSLIGAAPLVLGIVLIIFLAQWGFDDETVNPWLWWGRIYLLVTVSNSMFVSREDRRGWIGLGLLVAVGLVVAIYFFGRVEVWSLLGDYSNQLGDRINKGLWVGFKINGLLAAGLWLINKLVIFSWRRV